VTEGQTEAAVRASAASDAGAVTASGVTALGPRVREERVRRGLSLRGLARQIGVSASMMSQIETGKTNPSVNTLYAITSALGISIEEVFTASAPPSVDLSGPGRRESLLLGDGVTWERLAELQGRAVDFLRITYPPGGASSDGELMSHQGAEYGFVLTGQLVLTLGGRDIQLRSGDAVAFESGTPHRYHNDGTEDATGVWFVLEQDAGPR
jgi:transcriptional regulator with XRE-family HTH domain